MKIYFGSGVKVQSLLTSAIDECASELHNPAAVPLGPMEGTMLESGWAKGTVLT
jgi:hypothetical protein